MYQARCANVAECTIAEAGETLDWYAGAGEYCPQCGEALERTASTPAPEPARSAPPPAPEPARSASPPAPEPARSASPAPDPGPSPSRPPARVKASAGLGQSALRAWDKFSLVSPLRLFWIVAAALVVSTAGFYTATRRDFVIGRAPAGVVAVCPIPSAVQLATDLVREYAAKSEIPASRFVLTNEHAGPCDVRFSTASDTPGDVIARDGIVAVVNPSNPISRISQKQLREIFSGSIRDWSQLGMTPGVIVPMLPNDASDEAKSLTSSLLANLEIGHRVRRGGSSADVARKVARSDPASRNTIGLVAFSQAASAKILPLVNFPAPSVLSIATRAYPYTLAIAMQRADPARSADAAAGLIGFARSSDGATVVLENGLTPRQGL